MRLKRHTLLDITDSGREDILVELAGNGPDNDLLREEYAQIILPEKAGGRVPGIIRREETSLLPGFIPIGFSSPIIGQEGRLRVATFVQQKDISKTTSPYDLLSLIPMSPRNLCNTALVFSKNQAEELDITLGVWGSVALELYTGLLCTNQYSDLDLLVAVAPREALAHFLSMVKSIEAHLDLRIDIELELANGYGVHLKELFGKSRTVLGKSMTEVALLPREQILSELPQEKPVQSNQSWKRGSIVDKMKGEFCRQSTTWP